MLLFTAFPVVLGLMATEILDVANGYASAAGTLPTLVLQAVLCAVFLGGFVAASRAASGERGIEPDRRA